MHSLSTYGLNGLRQGDGDIYYFREVAQVTFYLALFPAGSRPKLTEPFRDVTVTAPKEAVFQCRVDLGQPPAKVRCYRDGRELADSSKYSTVVRGDEVRLVVRDTELSDEAVYRCQAYNKLGSVETEAKLTMRSTFTRLCRPLYQSLYVCMYVCMYISIYVCMNV